MSDYTSDKNSAIIGLDVDIMWKHSGPDDDKWQQHVKVDYKLEEFEEEIFLYQSNHAIKKHNAIHMIYRIYWSTAYLATPKIILQKIKCLLL